MKAVFLFGVFCLLHAQLVIADEVSSQEATASVVKSTQTALVFGKKELTLKARAQGELMEIKCDEGHRVKEKDVIAVFDDRRVKIDLELARAEFEAARKDFQSSQKLKKYVSSDEILQKEGIYLRKKSTFESKALDLVNTQIRAPIDGIVTKKYFEVGETVSVGDKVFEMVQLDELILVANLPSGDVAKFKTGSKISFRVEEIKDRKFDAEVFFISPVIDAASDTVRIKFKAKNVLKKADSQEYLLKPGMMALF